MNFNKFLEKSKKILVLAIMAIFMLMFIWFQYETLCKRSFSSFDSVGVARKFLVIAIFAVIAVFLSYFWIDKNRKNIDKIYLVSVLVLSIAYMFIFLPHVVPDEPHHYFQAFGLSNYFTFNFEQAKTDYAVIRQSDADWYNSIFSAQQNADYFYNIKESFSFFSKNNDLTVFEAYTVTGNSNAPFGYIFSALGIALARLFRFSPIITFYFGRIFNIVAYALMTWWAIKRIPYGKMAIFVISTLPMSLHLIASYSYDSQIIAFVMMFVAQVLYMREKDGFVTIKDIVVCFLFAMLVAPSKLVYLPVILLVFIIPKEKFNFSSKKVFLIKTGIVFVSFIFLLLLQIKGFESSATSTELWWANEPTRSLSWVLKNPIETLKIYVRTLFVRGEFYFNTLVGSHLGWFQISIPTYAYIPFYFFIIYAFMARDNEICHINFANKLWIFILSILSVVLIFSSLFLAWTPISYDTIAGVQGRYFIPLLIVAFLIIRNKFVTVNHNADKYAVFAVIYWNLFVGIQYFVTSFV